MGTRKTVDQILDGAADLLEKHGWVTESCYDSELGGFCVLGAIAKTVYPKKKNLEIGSVAYPIGDATSGNPVDPRHLEAVQFLAQRIDAKAAKRADNDCIVYSFNDELPSGTNRVPSDDGLWVYVRQVTDEKVRFKSSRRVVTRLRNAAKAYRKQQEKA